MIIELDNALENLWKLNAKPLQIVLKLDDYSKLNIELATTIHNPQATIHTKILSYRNITLYPSMEIQESVITAVKDGFYILYPIKPEGKNILVVDPQPIKIQ
ncbi:MAG: hypothetical protein WC365_07490 [Candidatus Babeliales bacterium]|jgi:hypothetical protein